MSPPKALLFDIGGVCVVSPFQAILDYERAHSIPVGYVNFSISRSAPNGAWQRLERGEMVLGDTYFREFKADLANPANWRAFWAAARTAPAATTTTTRAAADQQQPLPPIPDIDTKALFWEMMRMSRAPDPHMFPALERLRQSGKFIIGALSNTVIFPDGIVDDRGAVFESGLKFDDNTVPIGGGGGGSSKGQRSTEIRDMFDTFVSSAHVGLRKPDIRIYELAVKQINAWARENGQQHQQQQQHQEGDEIIKAEDILFLDDIGQNLKTAAQAGMRTLKVNLGKNILAVKELEKITGVKLLSSSSSSSEEEEQRGQENEGKKAEVMKARL